MFPAGGLLDTWAALLTTVPSALPRISQRNCIPATCSVRSRHKSSYGEQSAFVASCGKVDCGLGCTALPRQIIQSCKKDRTFIVLTSCSPETPYSKWDSLRTNICSLHLFIKNNLVQYFNCRILHEKRAAYTMVVFGLGKSVALGCDLCIST